MTPRRQEVSSPLTLVSLSRRGYYPGMMAQIRTAKRLRGSKQVHELATWAMGQELSLVGHTRTVSGSFKFDLMILT